MPKPTLISTPFATAGDKNTIQESVPLEPNNPTWEEGFPEITSTPVSEGGLPPKRLDFNGVLNAVTDNIVHQTKGLSYEFDAAYAAKIGGYPLHAELVLTNGDKVKSTVANNTTDPNVDMTGWFAPYMQGSQNLAELTDNVVARTNLGVYSKAETDNIAGIQNATETIAGKAKIATTAIAQAGTNDTDFLTAKKLRDALNAGGVLPVYGLRSWGVIKGTSNPASLVTGVNIASVIDDGIGQYRIVFSTPMPTLNYAILIGTTTYSESDKGTYGAVRMGTKTVNGFSIICGAQTTADMPEISFGVILP